MDQRDPIESRGFEEEKGSTLNGAPKWGGVTEVIEQAVGKVSGEFFVGMVTRGNGEGAGTDNCTTGDVVRNIADDPDVERIESDAGVNGGTAQSVRSGFVANSTVGGEGAEGEVVPKVKVAEFGLGAAAHIVGEQPLGDVGTLFGTGQNLGNAPKHLG